MGLPGFFAWLLKKYKEQKELKMIMKDVPQRAKRLYIDANCAFHPQCFKVLEHIEDETKIDIIEDKMIKRIINYIEYLIDYVNPEELVYISVDGVAPKAKIKQQRMRRFRSVDDAIIKEEIRKKHNKKTATKWSNTVITPGTEFMEKLHKELDEHFKKKTRKIKYIYSSYHTMGEGEHKILQHIKKDLSDKNNKDIYIIYGLDADLFFLSMASQKDNIYLLRESSQFEGDKRIKNGLLDVVKDVAEDLRYVSVDITKEMYNEEILKMIMSKYENEIYLYEKVYKKEEIENKDEKTKKNFCNDFIVICYLLGNDFLPHFPSIDIKKGGLDMILDSYCDIYLKNSKSNMIELKDGIVKLNNDMFKELLISLGLKEYEYFTDTLVKYKHFNEKRRCLESDPYLKELWQIENMKNIKIEDPVKLGYSKEDEWKFRYYNHYFNTSENMNETISDTCKNYLEGIVWVTKYYFEECTDWRWQYNYNHAPFISDLGEYFNDTSYKFEKVQHHKRDAISPCVQLMSVLPPQCSNELPISYRYLVTDTGSPVIDMFPKKVEIDMLNKDQLWQCIPLVPLLNEMRIIEAIKTYKLKLTEEEEERNKILEDFIY